MRIEMIKKPCKAGLFYGYYHEGYELIGVGVYTYRCISIGQKNTRHPEDGG
jgi:hypothetical protein